MALWKKVVRFKIWNVLDKNSETKSEHEIEDNIILVFSIEWVVAIRELQFIIPKYQG